LPVRDSILAIADANYFDWKVLPEAPSGLTAQVAGGTVTLQWQMHNGNPSGVAIERRIGNSSAWQRISTQPARYEFTDTAAPRGSVLCYRVRAIDKDGESAYSNVVRTIAR
jgi:hypothetical protein